MAGIDICGWLLVSICSSCVQVTERISVRIHIEENRRHTRVYAKQHQADIHIYIQIYRYTDIQKRRKKEKMRGNGRLENCRWLMILAVGLPDVQLFACSLLPAAMLSYQTGAEFELFNPTVWRFEVHANGAAYAPIYSECRVKEILPKCRGNEGEDKRRHITANSRRFSICYSSYVYDDCVWSDKN